MFLSHGGFFSISVRNLELTLCKNGTVFLGSLLRESPFASDVEFCLVCTMCYNLYFSSFTVVMGGPCREECLVGISISRDFHLNWHFGEKGKLEPSFVISTFFGALDDSYM